MQADLCYLSSSSSRRTCQRTWSLAETRKLNLFSYSGQGWHRVCTHGRAGGMQGTQRRAWARDGFSWCGMSYGTCSHLGEGSWLLWWRELPLPSTRPGRYVGQLLYCPNLSHQVICGQFWWFGGVYFPIPQGHPSFLNQSCVARLFLEAQDLNSQVA